MHGGIQRVLVARPEAEGPYGRLSHRLNNIIMDLTHMVWEGKHCVHAAQGSST